MSVANNVEAGNGHAQVVEDWYASFTHREAKGQTVDGVNQWSQSELGKVTEAVLAHRRESVTVVPEFPVKQPDGKEVAVSLKVVLHKKLGFSSAKDVSLALVTRDPNQRNAEIQPIESVNDLRGAGPEVLDGLANGLRGVPVSRPIRLG